jgi:hypothetical protein
MRFFVERAGGTGKIGENGEIGGFGGRRNRLDGVAKECLA